MTLATQKCGRLGCDVYFPVDHLMPTRKYCSKECKSRARRKQFSLKKCARPECGNTFEATPSNKIYCSSRCFNMANGRKRYGTEAFSPGMAPATVGAIGEMRVCIDLLIKGYEVFLAASPSCSCDLAALQGNHLVKFEVRTGYKNKLNGKVWGVPPKNTDADVFAVVHREGIEYRPLKEWIKCQTNWVKLWNDPDSATSLDKNKKV